MRRFLVLAGLLVLAASNGCQPSASEADAAPVDLPTPTSMVHLDDLVRVETQAPSAIAWMRPVPLALQIENLREDAWLSFSQTDVTLFVATAEGEPVLEMTIHPTDLPNINPTVRPGAVRAGTHFIIWDQKPRVCPPDDKIRGCLRRPVSPGNYLVYYTFRAALTQVLRDGETVALISEQTIETAPQWLTILPAPPWPTPSLPMLLSPKQADATLQRWLYAPMQVEAGGSATFRLLVQPRLDVPVEVPVLEPAYDFIVTNLDGVEVWRWTASQETSDMQTVLSLGRLDGSRRDSKDFEAVWDLTNNQGNPVPPGLYAVDAMLRLLSGELHAFYPENLFIGPQETSLADLVKVHLEAPASVEASQPVPLKLNVMNTSRIPIRMQFEYDFYDFILSSRKGGEEVRSRWTGFGIPLIYRGWVLQPGELKQIQWEWDQADKEGNPVRPGTYTLTARFEGALIHTDVYDMEMIEIAPRELTIR